MQLISLTTLFVALVVATTAAPSFEDVVPEADPRFAHLNLSHPHARIYVPHGRDIEKRDVGSGRSGFGYYECSEPHFRGECQWIELERGQNKCFNARWWPLGSMGPDKGVHCTVYEEPLCDPIDPHKADYTYPGTGDCPNYKWFGNYFTTCPLSWTCAIDG